MNGDDAHGVHQQHGLRRLVHILSEVPLLAPLSRSQLAELARLANVDEFPPGAAIMQEGTPGECFYIIEEGHVVILKQLGDEELLITRRGPGAIVGEMALIEEAVRSATVRAETHVRALRISREGFERMLAASSQVALDLIREISRRLRDTDRQMITTLLQKNRELRQAKELLRKSYDATLVALSKALDLRDRETEGHSVRVATLAVEIGTALGLDQGQLEHLWRGGLLHDIGKIGVPDTILQKPAPLSPQEWEIMKQHPVWGARILKSVDFLVEAIPVVRYHHEAWDGSGYPEGLRRQEIPLLARIFMVADTYDAVTSDRPYRSRRSPEEALAVIREERGRRFDPEIVNVFEALFPRIRRAALSTVS
ncbi:MAG: HD domain-containing protein [Ardenticatenia bacterium]|nr:HD domain-containing protein [Ardenticatenia bacterium]